jgi:glycosyltransferase involved in cell wall biosynthesis
MKDRISVIIPTFNRASVLLRAVDSVLNQTYRDIELIVVDDGSTDDTEKLLAPYIETQTIQYFKTQNKGVSASRNFGVTQAREKWIAFLDSDDEWLSPKLAKQMAFLEAHAHLSIVYSDEMWIRNDILVNKKNHHQKKGGWIFTDSLKQCLIGPSSVLLTKKLFAEMKGFDESFVVCEDYDLWLKISSKYEIGYMSEALIKKFGGHADQLSTRFVAMDRWRIKSMQNILRDKTLSAENRANVIAMMKEKGQILLKGYIKHGNQEAAHELEQILAQF